MEYQTVCTNRECNANWYKKLDTEICPLCGQKTIVYLNYLPTKIPITFTNPNAKEKI